MRRLAVVLLLVASGLPAGPTAFAGTPCSDVSRTFTGSATGVPDESLLGTSADASTHSVEIGSDGCRVLAIDAQLTSPNTNNLTSDAELVVSYEGIELQSSRNPGTNESVHLSDPPVGTYNFTVEDWMALQAPYTLQVQAKLASDPPANGPNADDETVVIAIVDSGINPYHDEFSKDTYPGGLDLDQDPADYLEGYPENAQALNRSLNTSYSKAVDADDWDGVEKETLYWIPGTKIVGAYDADAPTGTGSDDPTPLLDDDGHGTGSASVAAGNALGSCEGCLLVVVEGLQGYHWAIQQPWIDIVSNSWARLANVGTPSGSTEASPAALFGFDDGTESANLRAAVTRGQTVLFAAGNGNANLFLTPQQTYTSPYTGPDWTITVGATWAFDGTDNCDCSSEEGSALTSGKPVDVSSYAVGHIPAASHRSTDGHAQHGGTSAATPRVAGVMGDTLLAARQALVDTTATTRDPVIAEGDPVIGPSGGMLTDGKLTRAELERAVELTAQHSHSTFVGARPVTPPTFLVPEPLLPAQFAAEGWGVVTERTGANATDVVLGEDPMPARPVDQAAADADEANREALWGPAVDP